jgi:hypothetical protein
MVSVMSLRLDRYFFAVCNYLTNFCHYGIIIIIMLLSLH